MFRQYPRVDVDPDLIARLKRVSPSTLGHLTDFGFVRGLKPSFRPIKLVGPAVTVRIPHLDSTAVHCVLDVVQPGDVVVVDQSGDAARACWGGGVTYAAVRRGVAGAVVAGAMTDWGEILELKFPMYFRTISALTTRILGIEGEINVPVTIGGVVVRPGDVVFGDENGVAILSSEQAASYAPVLEKMEHDEVGTKQRLDAGESLATLSGARQKFDAAAGRRGRR
ncbi:MAG TPA: RraA family protein [bacterium]|nr:RraA family protein [bacterium]